jgi:hypothetical protein
MDASEGRKRKEARIMRERIRRAGVLFRELGYELFQGTEEGGIYEASFQDKRGFQAFYSIDRQNRFLELIYTFSFSENLAGFIKAKMEEIVSICYETGCYMSFEQGDSNLGFSIFSKIYFSGLNYESLRDCLADFKDCAFLLHDLLDPGGLGKGEARGNT